MKVFIVKRKDRVSWLQDYEMTVVAPDSITAINMSQEYSDDFRDCGVHNLKAIEINLNESRILTVAHTDS